MKKRILRSFIGLIFFGAFILPGCEFIEDCGTCTLIVEVDGVVDEDQTGVPLVYCGDKLLEKQNAEPTVIGTSVSYWDCVD